MDGIKKRLKTSIQLRLSLWLSIAITTVALVAGSFSFLAAMGEAHELQDDILRQIGALVREAPAQPLRLSDIANDGSQRIDPESRVIVQAVFPRGDQGGGLNLDPSLGDGLQTIQLRNHSYRTLVRTLPNGDRIAVLQDTRGRDEIARDGALRSVLPLLILMPILLIVATNLVRRMFEPVRQLASEIDARSEGELHPLSSPSLPLEVSPFVTAINRLLERVRQAMESQRRFVADAAHELRTPLTAMSLQAERLEGADMSAVAQERLMILRSGIERNRHLLDQLLGLARAQRAETHLADARTIGGSSPEALSVRKVFLMVMEDLMPLAEAKQLDIGLAYDGAAKVFAQEMDLVTAVRNLVDNAIRYTPPGGQVDLSASESLHAVTLEIEDSGPGIPIEERVRVLDPFYRVLGSDQTGSGLGLSIVKTLVERMQGKLELSDSTRFPQGLKASIHLAKAE